MYWMVPQMVNARPPRSNRRDKPKSARRRWPAAEGGGLGFKIVRERKWMDFLSA